MIDKKLAKRIADGTLISLALVYSIKCGALLYVHDWGWALISGFVAWWLWRWVKNPNRYT